MEAMAKTQISVVIPSPGRLELTFSTGSLVSPGPLFSSRSSRGGSTVTEVSSSAIAEPPEFIAPLEEIETSIFQFLRGWLSDAVAIRFASAVCPAPMLLVIKESSPLSVVRRGQLSLTSTSPTLS